MWKNKLKDLFYLASLLTLGWFCYVNYSNQRKIGYIDVKQVFNDFDLKKEMQEKYFSQMSGKKKSIDELGFELQKMGSELEASGKPEEKKMEAFLSKRKLYMQLVKTYDEEDKKINSEYDTEVIQQMNEYIKKYGEEKGYDLILGSMGNGNIMQAQNQLDLTGEVTAYINNAYAGK
jgi:outer membrane protein